MLGLALVAAALAAPDDATVVVFTASNRGELRPCGCPGAVYGGLAKRARVLRALEEEVGGFALLDAGDALFPNEVINSANRAPRVEMAKGILEALNQMDYDAVALGPLDLERGTPSLVEDPLVEAWSELPAVVLDAGGGKVVVARLDEAGLSPVASTGVPLVVLTSVDDAEIPTLLPEGVVPWLIVSSAPGATLSNPLLGWAGDIPVIRPTPKGKELGVAWMWTEKQAVESSGELVVVDEMNQVAEIAAGHHRVRLELRKIPRNTPDVSEVEAILRAAELRAQKADVGEPWQEWAGQSFGGVAACVGCHPGEVRKWETTAHAGAWAALEVDGSHQKVECVGCHSTGQGVDGGFQRPAAAGGLQDVQCEVCHGPSLQHAYDPGQAMPPQRVPTEQTCRTCHEADRTSAHWAFGWALPVAGCQVAE